MKKILAIAVALAMVMALSVPAFASTEHTAALMYADADWYPNLMSNDDPAQDTRPTITINGDGTYSIETDAAAGASGVQVLCIDLIGVAAEHPDATATLDSIEVDGEPFEFDASKIIYGDIEENGNYRIEILNAYGATTNDPPFIEPSLRVGTTIKFTFTVSGIGAPEAPAADDAAADDAADDAAAPADDASAPVEDGTAADNNEVEPEAPAADTAAPSTGLALAVVPAVIALAAVAVSKKR